MKEKIKKLLGLIKAMKKIESDGFPDEKIARAYFEEKEEILEEMGGILTDMDEGYSEEMEAVKATIGSMKESIKAEGSSPKTLSKSEFFYNLLCKPPI